MSTALVAPGGSGPLATPLEALATAAIEYAADARAANTVRSYETGWRQWADWCLEHGFEAGAADSRVVVLYLADLGQRGQSPETLRQRLKAIAARHAAMDLPDPTRGRGVKEVIAGIAKSWLAQHRTRQAAPLTWEILERAVDAVPDTPIGIRDRALLLVGFAGAFRRSELCALQIEDLELAPEGMVIRLRRSKTDQAGVGTEVAIPRAPEGDPHCPVRALLAWIGWMELEAGPLFRGLRNGTAGARPLTPLTVCRIVKAAVNAIGEDPSEYSGHSLRAGLATSAARAGASDVELMRQGRWASRSSMDRYQRERERWSQNAAGRVYGGG